MDMTNIIIGDIVAAGVDVSVINNNIKQRANDLASQMNPDAAAQFVSDMSEIECVVSSNGNTITGKLQPSQSYLLNYLKSHGTPVSGGDNGTAQTAD